MKPQMSDESKRYRKLVINARALDYTAAKDSEKQPLIEIAEV
jgi:hypothetical protein